MEVTEVLEHDAYRAHFLKEFPNTYAYVRFQLSKMFFKSPVKRHFFVKICMDLKSSHFPTEITKAFEQSTFEPINK